MWPPAQHQYQVTSYGPSPKKSTARKEPGDADGVSFVTDTTAVVSRDNRRRVDFSYDRTEIHRPGPPRILIPDEYEDYGGFNPDTFHTFGADPSSRAQTSVRRSQHLPQEEDAPAQPGGKRKRWASSDEPMRTWRPHASTFLRECFIHDAHASCMSCDAGEDAAVVKCLDCEGLVQCGKCCLQQHMRLPLHRIVEWSNGCWNHHTLQRLGLIYQLGHAGFHCPFPESRTRELVVVDSFSVHTITFQQCNCAVPERRTLVQQLLRNAWWPATVTNPATCSTFRVLEQFRALNVVGNVNVTDYVRAAEKLTDATGTEWVPSRVKEFFRATRQYNFLKRVKRAGRAHSWAGLEGTKAGELAPLCWACPHADVNLPSGWREVHESFAFVFMLVLSIDANFRLKNCLRKGERDDADLGAGKGFFVDPRQYREHIKSYVPEEDVSDCVAFAAMLQRDTKLTTGLRVSGVGGCFCARHGVLRPQGMGDLQKGERWVNMDFIVFSAIIGVCLLAILFTYDIGCQWKKKMWTRMDHLPPHLHVNRSETNVRTATPAWHGKGHGAKCYEENVITFQEGAGTVDGEGPEREWSVLNSSAYATKEMGEESHHNFIEDKLDHIVWSKNINQETVLPKKLYVALEERDIQVRNFREIDETLEPETRACWMAMVEKWAKEPDAAKNQNPYAMDVAEHESEQTIRNKLTKDEVQEARDGRAPQRATTVTGWLTIGLEIEHTQRRMVAEAEKKIYIDPIRADKTEERRHALFKKIAKFRDVAQVYCPGLIRATAADEDARDPNAEPPNAERVKIYLPSQLPAFLRDAGCMDGLVEKEAKLRRAQAADALDEIRTRILTRDRLIRHRNANVVGQNDTTRSATLIARVFDRVLLAAFKYEAARLALVELEGSACTLHPLDVKTDLTSNLGITGGDRAQQRINAMSVGNSHVPVRVPTLRAQMSWIWTAYGGPSSDDAVLHSAVRWEWARALARRNRWCEEVYILREEMRRVLRFLRKKESDWLGRSEKNWGERGVFGDGLRSYAIKQSRVYRRIHDQFFDTWSGPVKVGEGKNREPKVLPASAIILEDEDFSLGLSV